jgi:hypothetical protein
LSNGLKFVFNDLLFKPTKGARSNAQKLILLFSENELHADQKKYWDDLSDQLGVKIAFVGVQRKTGAKTIRRMLPLMYMENDSTLKEIGKLLGTGIV